jgi:hypothetical protein
LDWARFVEEFGQAGCSGGMHGGAQRQLDGLEVQGAGLTPFGEDPRQQRI